MTPAQPEGDAAPGFLCSDAGSSLTQACQELVDELVAAGFELPSVYLLHGPRLRCLAARGYFQVVDGFRPGAGVIGRVVASGVSELVADVRLFPDFISADPGILAEACAPVVVDGAVVGAVNVESTTALPRDALEQVEAAAAGLGRALARLGGVPLPSLAQRLAHVSVELTAATDTGQIRRRALEAAVELADMAGAAVMVAPKAVGHAHVVAETVGSAAEPLRSWGPEALAVLASWVGRDTSSHYPGGQVTPPRYDFLRDAGIAALSVHPLVVAGDLTGYLVLVSDRAVAHSVEVADCLDLLAAQTAAALSSAAVLKELSMRASRDDLTGLGNREAFNTDLTRLVSEGQPIALLLLDLDDFKHVNDSLGHQAGDDCLVVTAQRLVSALPPGAAAHRLGGDEFVVILDASGPRPAAVVAEQILHSVGQPASVAGTEIHMTVSVGIAFGGGDQVSPSDLLKSADLAMYLAKARGKGRYAVYEEHLRQGALDRLGLENDLRKAVHGQHFHLVYQPIVDLGTGRMTGAEALVRWQHPTRGAVSPADFIPVAEDTGLILLLGEWVLREASAQLLAWDAGGGDDEFRVSVNVSTRQLERPGLLDVLDECLDAGVPPARLVLEVTETALTVDSVAAMQMLYDIRDRGVQLAVDDFGTGYSSLSRLRSAPVSRLKIDRSFITEIQDRAAHVPIVEATMAMARGLGMGLVAEGVETPEQLGYLIDSGCPEAQGFLLSRPVAAEAVAALMHGEPPWRELVAAPPLQQPAPSAAFASLVELAVAPQVGLEQLVRPLLLELREVTGLAMTYLTRVDPQRNRQEVLFVEAAAESPIQEGLVVPWGDTLCKRALESGPRRTGDAVAAYPDTDVPRELDLRSYITEPVYNSDGGLYGTLCGASTQESALTEADNATLRMFARLVEQKLGEPQPPPPAPLPDGAAGGLARRERAVARWRCERARRAEAARRAIEVGNGVEADATLRLLDRIDEAMSRQLAAIAAEPERRPGAGSVVIAEDQRLLREMLMLFVASQDNLRLVAEAASAASAIGSVIAEQPDLLVLDYDLRDATAAQVVEDVREFSPGTRVLLHSAREDIHQLGQRLKVDRVVHKSDDPERLTEALRSLGR